MEQNEGFRNEIKSNRQITILEEITRKRAVFFLLEKVFVILFFFFE